MAIPQKNIYTQVVDQLWGLCNRIRTYALLNEKGHVYITAAHTYSDLSCMNAIQLFRLADQIIEMAVTLHPSGIITVSDVTRLIEVTEDLKKELETGKDNGLKKAA